MLDVLGGRLERGLVVDGGNGLRRRRGGVVEVVDRDLGYDELLHDSLHGDLDDLLDGDQLLHNLLQLDDPLDGDFAFEKHRLVGRGNFSCKEAIIEQDG